MENKNTPAFPVQYQDSDDAEINGLTKREYFAGLAMQGILAHAAHKEFKVNDWGIDSDRVAICAIDCADRLLKQLETT